MTISLTQAVAHMLAASDRPLTVDEILARAVQLPLATSTLGASAVRSTFINLPLVASLGGRPARYLWWPNALPGSVFRLPLAGPDLASGPWPLTEELLLALWPTFFVDRLRDPRIVTFVLPDGSTTEAQIDFVPSTPRSWGILPTPALSAWLARDLTAGAALIVRVLDVQDNRYALALARPEQRNEAALAARNRALKDAATEVLRAAHDDLPDFYLVPRLIARGAYRDPLPPDPLEDLLRADIGFIVRDHSIQLVSKLVGALERDMDRAIILQRHAAAGHSRG